MEFTVQATLAGIHPRSEELVQATRDLDRGRTDAKALAEVRRRDAQALVDVQHKGGFTHVSDGLLAWQDLFRPFAERVDGLQVGPLTRYFDNNTFYRQPVVTGTLRRKQKVVEPYHEYVKLPAGHRWKAVLPGPYTFAKLADDKAYGSTAKLLASFARDALAPEVKSLAGAGFGWVQFQEPALVRDRPQPEELDALEKAYLGILDEVRITSSVAAPFGDASRLLHELFELPVDFIGVDLYETPLEAFEGFQATRGLQAGLVDGRSSIVEEVEELIAAAERLLAMTEAPALALAPNGELEFVPRALADEKLLVLGEAARALTEAQA
jgi:5-methyltetrahydropteroyltriglutamate--homocysteine methyltransferase